MARRSSCCGRRPATRSNRSSCGPAPAACRCACRRRSAARRRAGSVRPARWASPRVLSAAEILDQVVLAGERMQAEGRRVRNIVFMGMGEPFHNEEADVRSGRRPALARIVPPHAGPHSHFDGRHSGRDDPLCAAISGSESGAQPAQRAAGRARAADSAGRQVFARRTAGGRRPRSIAIQKQHGDDRIPHAGGRE